MQCHDLVDGAFHCIRRLCWHLRIVRVDRRAAQQRGEGLADAFGQALHRVAALQQHS